MSLSLQEPQKKKKNGFAVSALSTLINAPDNLETAQTNCLFYYHGSTLILTICISEQFGILRYKLCCLAALPADDVPVNLQNKTKSDSPWVDTFLPFPCHLSHY